MYGEQSTKGSTEKSGFGSGQRQEINCFLLSDRPRGLAALSCNGYWGSRSLRVKQPRREAEHLVHYMQNLRKRVAVPPLHHTRSYGVVQSSIRIYLALRNLNSTDRAFRRFSKGFLTKGEILTTGTNSIFLVRTCSHFMIIFFLHIFQNHKLTCATETKRNNLLNSR